MIINQFIDLLKIYDCEYTKIRIGNKNDGGYVLCRELLDKTNRVYSFGIGDDVGFELDLLNRFENIQKIEMFDPTINNLPVDHPKFDFFKNKKLYSIEKDSLFKMDIECNEWDFLTLIPEEDLLCFNQMVIEFHIFTAKPFVYRTPYFTNTYNKALGSINTCIINYYCGVLEKLNKYFFISHIHVNNSLPEENILGIVIPPLLEISFVRRDLIKKLHLSENRLPIDGLDSPNKTDRPDILNFNSMEFIYAG